MNFVFIALFITTITGIVFSTKAAFHLFILLLIALVLFLGINWYVTCNYTFFNHFFRFISDAQSSDSDSPKDDKFD